MKDLGKALVDLGITCPHELSDGGYCGRKLRTEAVTPNMVRCTSCNRGWSVQFRYSPIRDYSDQIVTQLHIILVEEYGT